MSALPGFYGISVAVSMVVLYWRAGLNKGNTGVDWRQFVLSNPSWWVVFFIGKSLLWPIPLVQWFAAGTPASAWRATTRLDGREVRAIVRPALGRV